MDKHTETYKEEAYELLAELETSLLELEEKPDDADLIGRIFRAMHTIKGSGAMFGFDDIASFTHEVETVFDLVRNGEMAVTKELIDLTLAARDQIRSLLDASSGETAADMARGAAIVASLKNLVGGGEGAEVVDEATLRGLYNVLSEYEMSRLKACRKHGRNLYLMQKTLSLDSIDRGMQELSAAVKKVGEVISAVPSPDAVDQKSAAFTYVYASPLRAADLEAQLGTRPRCADRIYEFLDEKDAEEESAKPAEITYRIRFRPSQDILATGTNPLLLLNELRGMGKCTVVAHTEAIPELGDIEPERCYTTWDIILTTERSSDAVRDVFIFVEDISTITIDVIDEAATMGEAEYKKLGDILVERGDLTEEELRKVLGRQKRIGEMLVEAKAVALPKVESALAEQQHVKEVREKHQAAEAAASIRVSSERLDSLVNLVGELVTVQAHLSQVSFRGTDPELLAIAEEVERLTGEMRDHTMSLRMLPIGTTFSKFKRLVRDLSKDLGKEVEMTTEGAETELDKTVIEKLNDPLVHLIRNSIDHGIESPEVRIAAGKPKGGTVHLTAVHSGANVLIRISDDGAGLDEEVIRAKAVERGLIQPDEELSKKEIYSLILLPGFSTAKKVTNVSGRGVGMDVVKNAITTLRGTIEIESEKGVGTTMTLKLPLTLAIIEGFLVKVADDFFVMPLSVVEECIELTREDIERAHGRHLTDVRGHLVPYVRLREQFFVPGERPGVEQIVIVGNDGHRVGFVVDTIIGEHQTVIKSLGRAYRDVRGMSGATILGDGTVALILDVPRLVSDAIAGERCV